MATIPVKNKRPIIISGTFGEKIAKLIDVVGQMWERLNEVIYDVVAIKTALGGAFDLKYIEAKIRDFESTTLTAVVEDTTPQLGGNLDVNGKTITSASSGNVTISADGSGVVNITNTTLAGTTTVTGGLHLPTTTISSSPYNVTTSDYAMYCNTSGGGITLNLLAGSGVVGQPFRIANCGTAGYDVVVHPSGTDLLDGVSGVDKTLSDGSVLDLVYVNTLGWR